MRCSTGLLLAYLFSVAKGKTKMMEPYDDFDPKGAHETVIWRYIDLAKLVLMLDERALVFPTADLLGDPWEGSPGMQNVQLMGQRIADIEGEGPRREAVATWETGHRNQLCSHGVSCWHVSTTESPAMWQLYSDHRHGVALQTTVGQLLQSLDHSDAQAWVGMVKYIDYEAWWMPDDAPHHRFFYKRSHLRHEQELRIVMRLDPTQAKAIAWARNATDPAWDVYDTGDVLTSLSIDAVGLLPDGLCLVGPKLPLDTARMNLRVVIAPRAEPIIKDAVTSIIDRYESRWPVVSSAFGLPPVSRLRTVRQAYDAGPSGG